MFVMIEILMEFARPHPYNCSTFNNKDHLEIILVIDIAHNGISALAKKDIFLTVGKK